MTGTARHDGGALLSIQECAAVCGVSSQTVRRWVLTGQLPACKLGPGRSSPVRIRREDLEQFINPILVTPDIRRAVPPWTLH